MNNQWEHQLHLVRFIPVGQGTFSLLAVGTTAMGVCCVPIHHQTGTDIGRRRRLAEANRVHHQGVPPVLQLPAPRLWSALGGLPSSCGRPACARTDCPVVVHIVTCGGEQDVGEMPAGMMDCCTSCGASRYTETALHFPLPRRWGQPFLGSLPMSIKYRNGRMCWSKFQSCHDFVVLIYRTYIYIYVL